MSLLTLLEAAKYLDYRAEAQARGEEPHDYNTYASHLPPDREMSPNSTNNSCLSQPSSPVLMEEVKEKQHNFGNNNKHVQSEDDSGANVVADAEWGESWLRYDPGLGTREVHNRLEKNRRAHLKECFETLKKQLPNMEDKKTSNLSILRSALRYIQTLKRKQRDYEHEMEKLARDKILQQQRLASLKKELLIPGDDLDISEQDIDVETLSTSTASETGALSDLDDEIAENGIELSSQQMDHKMKPTKAFTNMHISSATISRNQVTLQVPSTPALPMQTITVSKPTSAAITVNSLVNSLASQSTHLQIPAQMGLHVNGGTNVISHPATVQVITPQAVRVISAAPSAGIPVLNTVTTVSSTPSFAATMNVVTPRMTSITAVAATTGQKGNIMPTTMTLAKPNLLPVTVAAVVSQPQQVGGKGLVGAAVNHQLAVKASGISALGIPTTLTALSRGITLHTTSSSAIQVNNSNKPIHHILQSQICAPRAVIPHGAITSQAHSNIMSAQLNNVVRQVMTVKPGTQLRAAPIATQITHMVQPAPGQLVTSGNHVSTVTPIITPVNMGNHTATMAQVIAAQSALGKVTASPQILKSVNQIPLVQAQQFLPSAQPLVKPVVVVSTPSVVMTNGTTSVIGGTMSHST